MYFFNFFLRGIFWINIGIYNCKYNKNKFVASMISYIEYIMIFLILETGIGETIFYKKTNDVLFIINECLGIF